MGNGDKQTALTRLSLGKQISSRQKLHLTGCAVLLAAAVIFSVGSAMGFAIGRLSNADDNAGSTVIAAETDRALAPDDLDIFWEAMELVEEDFYGELPAPNERSYGAIRGVLETLDDKNTGFLAPDEATSFMESIEGSFEGIGAMVEWAEDEGAVRIIEPFEDQPAWNAGIRPGDLIIAINGQDVAELTGLNEAINRIKGPKGTEVHLTVRREGLDEPLEFPVTRALIDVPVVESEIYGDNDEYAYVALKRFSVDASRKLRDELENLLTDDTQGLIFDLRSNPGGLLREAIRVTSIFLEDERVLIERFSDGTEEIYNTEGSALVPDDLPMIVLVNGGSASASEIVAGALQDVERARLLGVTTFGKGSVQLPHTLSDDSLLRVTIALWYTPSDRSIDDTGLEPDIVVERTIEQRENEEDPQLDRALELLRTGE
ncbi:MAG: S41 family peptidase [Caldilineaceae bacterium SB0668_bin_21]|nr:S41 family peptidase [Caldilineaceae bacterium SB0668_bin_21]MYC23983.1 S41 family peptidase [Caldilineaceae bacterium SB0662_bin_25]